MVDDSSARIGLIGVGTMGLLVGSRLSDAGRQVVAFDPSPRAQEAARRAGFTLAATPRDTVAQIDGGDILLVLPGPREVEAAVLGPDGVLTGDPAPRIIVDLTTSEPATTQRMAQMATECQAEYLDAPILGRPRSVGRWVLPVGGNAAALDRCRSTLECFANKVVYVGPTGSGHTLKLLNTLMFGAINAMTAEMLVIAERVGLPASTLFDVMAESEAATVSGLFKEVGPKIIGRDFSPTFSIDLLCKDIGLAVAMCRAAGAPPVLGSTVQLLNERAQARGWGKEDTSALALLYEELLGVDSERDTSADGEAGS